MTNCEKKIKKIYITNIQQLSDELASLMNERQRLQKLDAVSPEILTQLRKQLREKIAKIENAQHMRTYHIERRDYEKKQQGGLNSALPMPAVSLAASITILPTILGISEIINAASNQAILPLGISIPLACALPICVCGVQLFCNKDIVENQVSSSWENPKLRKLNQSLQDVDRVLFYKKQGKQATHVIDLKIKDLMIKRDEKIASYKNYINQTLNPEHCKP